MQETKANKVLLQSPCSKTCRWKTCKQRRKGPANESRVFTSGLHLTEKAVRYTNTTASTFIFFLKGKEQNQPCVLACAWPFSMLHFWHSLAYNCVPTCKEYTVDSVNVLVSWIRLNLKVRVKQKSMRQRTSQTRLRIYLPQTSLNAYNDTWHIKDARKTM